ncbi:hypothetical protein ACGFIY_21155 [Micromonospora chersina]|uniref:hypothetical protein n=1 Tax=Micromonospora chersina TaxID=47854 RepID=UPI003716BCCF
MGVQAIEGGYDTTRIATAADDERRREQQRAAAYGNLTAIACNRFLGSDWNTRTDHDPAKLREARAWRDETAAALGLNPRKATA